MQIHTNTTPIHTKYISIAGRAPAADPTRRSPALGDNRRDIRSAARKQAVGDIVVGPEVLENGATISPCQPSLPVSLFIAHIDGIKRLKRCTQGNYHGKILVTSSCD